MKPIALILAGAALLPFLDASAAPRDRCLQGPFHRITQTNAIGEIIGQVDRQDWGCLGASNVAPGTVPSDIPVPTPTDVCFSPAAPNPASGATRLEFTLPQASHVTLAIYGESVGHGPRQAIAVRSLMDGQFQAGAHQVNWDLRNDAGAPLAPGLYRAVLTTDLGTLCGDIEVQ
jgi:hypothetical protein